MFVCLLSGGYRRTLRETISGQRVRVRRVPVPGGDGFVTAQISDGRFPTQEILRIVRRCGGKALCPQGICLPQALDTYSFTARAFPLYLAMHTLENVLRLARISPRRLCIGVCDPDAVLADALECLLPFCGDLRIRTDSPSSFDAFALTAYRTLGACVTARTGEDALCGCDLILRGTTWRAHGTEFRCVGVVMPELFLRFKPEQIDAELFAAALLEQSGVRQLRYCTARAVEADGAERSIRETAQEMREFFEKNY